MESTARSLRILIACTLAGCGSEPAPPSPPAGVAPPSDAATVADLPAEAPPAGVTDPEGSSEVGLEEPVPLDPGVVPPVPAFPDAAVPDAAAPSAEPPAPLTLFLVGDSIVQEYPDTASESDQAGWGQMLGEFFDSSVSIVNRAIGGRTARRFIDEGRLDEVSEELEPGAYLLVQFGTNDGNRTATYDVGGETIPYFLEPQTDFKRYLLRYIELARARGVSPVLVTPTPRNSAYCTGGNGTGAHAQAMRELGADEAVPVVDLNTRAVEHLRAICPAPQPESFFLLRPDGSVDGTHFQENGARVLAGFVADELRTQVAELNTRASER